MEMTVVGWADEGLVPSRIHEMLYHLFLRVLACLFLLIKTVIHYQYISPLMLSLSYMPLSITQFLFVSLYYMSPYTYIFSYNYSSLSYVGTLRNVSLHISFCSCWKWHFSISITPKIFMYLLRQLYTISVNLSPIIFYVFLLRLPMTLYLSLFIYH